MEENIKYDEEGKGKGNRKGLPGLGLPGLGSPRRLPQRKSIRLKGYDYSQAGLYFITICCDDMKHRFGRIENGVMILNELGQIAHDEWLKLAERFPNMELDAFQIMPNHMHGIIELSVRAPFAVALKREDGAGFI
jgi:putative transposase